MDLSSPDCVFLIINQSQGFPVHCQSRYHISICSFSICRIFSSAGIVASTESSQETTCV
ncbi:hypothetical protein BASA_1597 [Bifidobacterium animalis subsp. animalis]|nr:hypothetical protein BASA_1597 [Bifidobacterium animalis subsp. animalis]